MNYVLLCLVGVLIGISIQVLIAIKNINANKQEKRIKKKGKNGCYHTSNKNLKVTSMGDTEEWYLCEKCGQKVKESELNE